MKKIMKLSVALIMMVAMAVTGCSSGGGKAAGSDKVAGSDKAEIVVWAWDVALEQLEQNAIDFQKDHPDVTFVFEDMGTDQIYSKLVTSLSTGIGLPDVVAIEGEQMSGFGNKFPDKFLNLNDLVEKDKHLAIKMSEVMVEGNVLAFPWDGAPMATYYRRDAFEAAGVNAEDIVTWDDFIEAGKKVEEKTDFRMMPMSETAGDLMYRTFLSQLGGFYFDAEGNTVVDAPESIKAMEMVKKLYDAGITQDYSGWDEYILTITAEKVATISEAVWLMGSIKEEADFTNGKWGVIPLPKFEAGGSSAATNGGAVVAIPSTTKNPDIVKEYVKFAMTDEESLVAGFEKYGLYPSYIPVYENEIFTKTDDFFGGQKVYEIFNEYGKEIPAVNYTENFAEALEANKSAISKILLSGEPVDVTMQNLQKELETKFGK